MTADDKLPAFMASVVRYSDPGFNPADLLPEMAVVMILRYQENVRAKVISKARVWVTLEEIGRTKPGQPRRWRMRLDDQTDGVDSNYCARFRTLAQHEYRTTLTSAQRFLDQQGIQVSGPWMHDVIKLARLVWPGRKEI